MKYGIITFHRAQNFGAILQTYALQKSIEKLGKECEVIDYRSEFIESYYKPYSIKNIPTIKKIAAILLKNGRVKDNRKSFDDFTSTYLKMSENIYRNIEELKESNNVYDTFITGSDQVWSYLTAGFDKSYFLDFVKDNNKKNSYAASFGVNKIPSELKNTYKNLLYDFNNISVREHQGKKIINDILNVNPQVVLDPTLLLNHQEWQKISSPTKEKEEYLLLYLMAESKSIMVMARKIAKKRNLKIIYINDRIYKRKGMDNRERISVNEWISLFINANCIVTNSFHGISFSINFNKEFFMQYLPSPAKVNSRLENILNLFDLNDRHIENKSNIDLLNKIDYIEVNRKLAEERKKSINYLINVN